MRPRTTLSLNQNYGFLKAQYKSLSFSCFLSHNLEVGYAIHICFDRCPDVVQGIELYITPQSSMMGHRQNSHGQLHFEISFRSSQHSDSLQISTHMWRALWGTRCSSSLQRKLPLILSMDNVLTGPKTEASLPTCPTLMPTIRASPVETVLRCHHQDRARPMPIRRPSVDVRYVSYATMTLA